MGFHIKDGWLQEPSVVNISDFIIAEGDISLHELGFIRDGFDYIDLRCRFYLDDSDTYDIRCAIERTDYRWVVRVDDIEDNDTDSPEGLMREEVLTFVAAAVELTDELNFTNKWDGTPGK